jgi:hypothetical protein
MKRVIDPAGWGALWVLVFGILMFGLIIVWGKCENQWVANCKAHGGVPYQPYRSRHLCLKPDSVIELN